MDSTTPTEPGPGLPPGSSPRGPLLAIGVTLLILGAIGAILATLPSEEERNRPPMVPGNSSSPTKPPAPEDNPPADPNASSENTSPETSSTIPSPLVPDAPDAADLIAYRGRVSSPSGELIAGVTVLSGPEPSIHQRSAETDEKGRFTIDLPANEPPIVRMSAPGYYRQKVELEREREDDLPYLLFRGGLISGTVTGPKYVDERRGFETEPGAGVTLEFAGRAGWSDSVTTGANGAYSITAPFGAVVIHVRSDRFRDQQILDVEALRTQDVTHDIQLTPGIQLDVVLFGSQPNGEKKIVPEANVRAFTGMGLEGEATSSTAGKATISGLTPGPGRIVVVRSGYRAELHSLVIEGEPALVRRPVHLDPSTPWQLEVVDTAGNPRPDAEVRISFQRIELLKTTAGNSEALDILGRDRRYRIDITAKDAPRTQRRFRIPSSGPAKLRVVLPKGGRFTGKALDDRGRPVAGAGVLISPTGGPEAGQGPPRLATTTIDGSFRTELCAPGPYRVQIQHPQLGRTTVEARIVDGEDHAVGDLQLKPLR